MGAGQWMALRGLKFTKIFIGCYPELVKCTTHTTRLFP